MHFGLPLIRPIPACVWVMILVLLHPVLAMGQNNSALSLDECLALAREQNPVLSAPEKKSGNCWQTTMRPVPSFFPASS